MVSRSILVQNGKSAVLWDHHIIAEQYGNNDVLRLLQNNSQLLNADASGQPLNGNRAFDINATGNRIYLPADTVLAAALDQTPHTGNHLVSYLRDGIGEQLQLIQQSPTFRAADAAFAAGDSATLRPLLLEINTQVNILQDAAKLAIINGDLYTNYPAGMNRAAVNAINANFFADPQGYLAQHADQWQAIDRLQQQLGEGDAAKFVSLLGPDDATTANRIATLLATRNGNQPSGYLEQYPNGNLTESANANDSLDTFLKAIGEPPAAAQAGTVSTEVADAALAPESAATAGGEFLSDAQPGAVSPDALPASPPGAQESVAAADQSVVETRLGAPESGNALPDSSLAVEPAPVSGNAAGPDTLSVTEPNGTATPEFAAEAPAVAVDGGAVEAGAGTPGTLGTVFGAAALVGGTAFDLYSGASIAGQYGLGSTQFMNWAVKSGPTELGTWGAAAIGYSAAIGDGASVFGAIGSGVGLAGEAFGPAAVLGSLAQIGYGAYQDINSGKSVFSWNSNAGVALDGNKYALIGAGIGTLVEPGGGTGIGYAIGAALDFGTAYHTNWLNQNPAQGLANQLNSNAYNESMAGAPEPDPMSGITYGFTPAPRSYFTATPTDSFGYQSVIQDAGTPNERVVQTFFVGWQSPSNAPGPWPGATTDYGVDGTATAPPADPLIARGISTMADVYALDRVQQAEAAAENPPANPANAAAPPSPAASAPQDAPSSPAPAPAWWNSPALTSDLGSGSSDTGNGQIGDGTASAIGTTPRRRATAPETRRRRTRLLAVSAAVARGTVQKRETKC